MRPSPEIVDSLIMAALQVTHGVGVHGMDCRGGRGGGMGRGGGVGR
jgi:hypothetical protein